MKAPANQGVEMTLAQRILLDGLDWQKTKHLPKPWPHSRGRSPKSDQTPPRTHDRDARPGVLRRQRMTKHIVQ
jgi:hypothetical protein